MLKAERTAPKLFYLLERYASSSVQGVAASVLACVSEQTRSKLFEALRGDYELRQFVERCLSSTECAGEELPTYFDSASLEE
jgi:hypothetical protein